MTFKELSDEVELRCMPINGELMFQPKPVDNKDLVKRLKNLHADLLRLKNTSILELDNDINTIADNLGTEIDDLEETPDPKPILIDNCKEVWINHNPKVMLEE